jgi:hypothetical protein
MRLDRIIPRILAAAIAVSLAAACEIVARDADGVSVDVGYLGEVAPGTRAWLSWLQANEHCAQFGKEPELIDLKGSVAVYRCVLEK